MSTDNNINIARRLKLFRELIDIDQIKLARAIKVPVKMLRQFEKGEKTGIDGVSKFASLYEDYGLSLTWLACGEENIFAFRGAKTPLGVYIAISTLYNGTTGPIKLEHLVKILKNESLLAELESSINGITTEFDNLVKREKALIKQSEQLTVQIGQLVQNVEYVQAAI